MAKKRKPAPSGQKEAQEKSATLGDLLHPDIRNKLNERKKELSAQEQLKQEALKQQADEARRAEQKRLENDFEYLLNNSSPDWRSHKS